MDNDFISIVIPVYNAESYLDRCITSVLKQDYQKWEMILVDDGSADNSLSICGKYAETDSRIKIIPQNNRGSMSARKTAIELAKGSKITFLDADDEIGVGHLSGLLAHAKEADCVVGGCTWIKTSGEKVILKGKIPPGKYFLEDQLKYIFSNMLVYNEIFYQYGILPYMCTKLFRTDLTKDVIKEVHLNIKYGDDQDFVWRYLLRCNSISIIDNEDYYYYQIDSSQTNKKNELYLRDLGQLYASLYELFSKSIYAEELLRQLEMYIWTRLSWIPSMMPWNNSDFMEEWGVPLLSELPGKKIVLYGAGKIGNSFRRQLVREENFEIVAWVDRNYSLYQKNGMNVEKPEIILEKEFDCVIVAVGKNSKLEVLSWLKDIGVPDSKVFWKCWISKKVLP